MNNNKKLILPALPLHIEDLIKRQEGALVLEQPRHIDGQIVRQLSHLMALELTCCGNRVAKGMT